MSSSKDELTISAARWALGDLPSWELPALANAMFDSGTQSQAVIELATMKNATAADAGRLFERALLDAAIDTPSKADAVWILLRHHVGRLATGQTIGRPGLKPIMDLYYLSELQDNSREYAGDSHGIHHLVGAYWGYADLDERPSEVSLDGLDGTAAVAALDAKVARLARQWLELTGA